MKLLALLLLGSLTISFILAKKTYIIETADDEDNNGEDFAAEVKGTEKSNENKDTWKNNNKWKKDDTKWQSGKQCGTRNYAAPVSGLSHGQASPGEFPWTCIL